MIIIDSNKNVFVTEPELVKYLSGTPPYYSIFTPINFSAQFELNDSLMLNPPENKKLINPWTYWNNDSKLESIRLQRDYFLGKSDWIVSKYAETLTEVPQNWRDYRQALRDFPSTVDVNLPIEQIVWPVSP